MKKLWLIVAVSLCAALLLSSCGGGADKAFPEALTCEEVMTAALNALDGEPEAESYYSSAKDDAVKLDEFELSLLEDGLFEACPEYSEVKDYALYICNGKETFELQVLKAGSEEGAEKLKGMLDRRIQTISGGDKAMYDPSFDSMIKNAQTYTDGLFAVLMITSDNSAARSAIDALKK